MNESFYSLTYDEARSRFIDSAIAAGASLKSYSLPVAPAAPNEFTINVAAHGPDDAPTIVVSSGLHGVEGFLGSAIQLAMLDELQSGGAANIRWVFIHAINPFGFSRIRRCNEDNVDLNRNFLLPNSQYTGAPANYARLNSFLNPAQAPSRFDAFRLKALWNVARHGMQTLKQCIAAGQYEYPSGIFYGGSKPSPAMEVIQRNCEQWIGSAQRILHVDFHSGLGAFSQYKLLLTEPVGSQQCQWYQRIFGHESVEAMDDASGIAYSANGTMGQWLQHHFATRDYRFVTAEFGTYSPIRVLAAIRAENCAHHFATEQSQFYRNAKRELLECFCPADTSWRRQVIDSGLTILQQGVSGLEERTSLSP